MNYFGANITQYLINTDKATISLDLEFGLYNIAPYYLEGVGYLGEVPALAFLSQAKLKHAAFQTFIDIGLNAYFYADYAHVINR